ncbi:MAG: hypothetical protein HGA80_02210 [Candidatus Omnitrophica bacterium]|nr:hypothetical protein [Candidatus Omnitrophota bacterium]
MVVRLNNESGLIMVLVTMMVIVMSVVMVGLLGRNFSAVLSSEEQLRRIEAEEVARGAYWRAYQNMITGGIITNGTGYSEVVDGRTYTVGYTIVAGAGPGGTNAISVSVGY